ncbi:MAG: amino acid adenylation domain-containing protein [Myxococcales bacterium]|nr:amino acid adenylation domain-containing protein [Myxococcales bacterium]
MGHAMGETQRTLRSGFLASCERFPDRPALHVAGREWSYAELRARADAFAATLESAVGSEGPPLTAVLGHRSASAFAGVLAALLRGHGYVPLNPAFPADRTRAMLERSDCRAVIVDPDGAAELPAVLDGLEGERVFLLPDEADAAAIAALAAQHPAHRFLGAADLAAATFAPKPADPDGIAYLLFTSGSTGVPKGVMVAHRNVTHFIDAMVDRYDVDESDRFSQLFDLTFDLSVFDLFVAWERGACVCCPSHPQKMLPARYVSDRELTIWFSVPSTAVVLNRLRKLEPGAFPGLRLALFCGEALPADLTAAFAAAAPGATVENLYGPTELTIACTLYRWDPERSPAECERGLVPIGSPYPGMEVLVVDEELREVAPGEAGELLMTGPQRTLGYWQDPDKTAEAFLVPPGRSETFYRTGDRVRSEKDGAPMVYLGRADHQLKIQGYRVELGEIESVLRDVGGVDVAIALGWPETPSGADGVVAFVAAGGAEAETIRREAGARLPAYMAPREVFVVERFPLNANGKVDRKALRAGLESS